MKTPRGTARALRRAVLQEQRAQYERDAAMAERFWEELRAQQAHFRALRDEGYSYEQAMLMSGRGDPDSLGLSQ